MSDELSIFQVCSQRAIDDDYGFSGESILECVSNSLEYAEKNKTVEQPVSFELDFFFLLAGSLVFFMQVGFAMLCAGNVRKKNVQNTMLKNLLDCCGAAIAWYCTGYAFAFGGQDEDDHSKGTTFIGTRNFLNTGNINLGFWFYQYTFAAATVTIVAGTLAERSQMLSYLLYSVWITGFVYPVVVHSIWSENGFLSTAIADPFLDIGMVDFAGGGVVHVTGGTTALIAAWVLGSRRGRFFDIHTGKSLDKTNRIKGHSIALQLLGTMCLWFGWYGFNGGSALLVSTPEYRGPLAARAAVNTSLAAAMGCISALLTNLHIVERQTGEYNFDLVCAMNGSLSGLVAITPCCAVTDNWAALIIGVIAGWIYLWSSAFLIRYKIDDAVDAIPVHMFNGIWGVIATGFFASPSPMGMAYGNAEHVGWFYSLASSKIDAHLLGCQLFGLIFIISWVFITMLPFFLWLNWKGWFRSETVQELVGLDISYHGRDELVENDAEEEEMKDEYLDAYDKYKSSTKKNQSEGIQSKEMKPPA